MLPLILAVVDASTLAAISALVALGVSAITFVRLAGGKANERQIEPTSLAAIQAELRGQTSTLNNINREVGEVKTRVDIVATEVTGFHQRVSGISRELAATTARVDGLEKREGK